MEWSKIKFKEEDNNFGRAGHTMFPWKKGFLLFGGEKAFNKTLRMRECFSDIKIFSLNKNEWKGIRILGDQIEPRRNNASSLICKYLIIYGGMNNYGKYLKDFCFINLEVLKWECIELDDLELGEYNSLAFHTMVPIFRAKVKFFSFYNKIEYFKSRKQRNVKEEGLYVFGGKSENGKVSNLLFIIQINTKPFISIPKIKGIPPSPRHSHTMDYIEELNILVIYGGRCDTINK